MGRRQAQHDDEDRRSTIDELAKMADLPAIAQENGLDVTGINTANQRAICPFHDDHRPSLRFYRSRESGRGLYHCFTCGAHGDAYDLVKKLRACDFANAVDWLANRYGRELPSLHPTGPAPAADTRAHGLELAQGIYRIQTGKERNILSSWAEERGYSFQFLTDAGVFAALGNKLTRASANDREAADALQAAGLIMRGTGPGTRIGETQSLPIEIPARDLFSTARVVFAIHNADGGLSGFAGRAVGKDDQPKYLFSQGFPRGETLYRIERAMSLARAARARAGRKPPTGSLFHLILVEGFVDALRLESAGLHAAAILGNRLAAKQAELLVDLGREWDRSGTGLAVHLFLDSDQAGRKGTVASLCQLMELAAETTTFCVDVICPPPDQSSQKHDPDEILRGMEGPRVAGERTRQWCHSAMAFLLANGLGCDVGALAEAWRAAPASLRIAAFRDVERCIHLKSWPLVLNRVHPFQRWWSDEAPEERQEWELRLLEFLRSEPRAKPMETREEERQPAQRCEEARLLHALQLAQSSTQRRELPVDDPSWERLLKTTDVVIPWFQELLRSRESGPLEPMVAAKIPRPDGDYRLKALACPEDLALQQYLLDEILRDNPECRHFLELIPAVSGGERLYHCGGRNWASFGGRAKRKYLGLFSVTCFLGGLGRLKSGRHTGTISDRRRHWRYGIGPGMAHSH